jgi:hypothetical protein
MEATAEATMTQFRKIGRSAELMTGMADRLGVPLDGPDPEASAQRFMRLTLACVGCAGQDDCARLQAENRRLDAAPDYCRNKATLTGRGDHHGF